MCSVRVLDPLGHESNLEVGASGVIVALLEVSKVDSVIVGHFGGNRDEVEPHDCSQTVLRRAGNKSGLGITQPFSEKFGSVYSTTTLLGSQVTLGYSRFILSMAWVTI